MKRFFSVLLFVLIGTIEADIDVYPFETPEQEARFHALIEEFRCPKCQNQNLADSNAPIANDLRALIHEQILAGKSDAEIKRFLRDRYGDFVLYRPPLRGSTLLLWFGPLTLLLVLLVVIGRRLARRPAMTDEGLNDDERRQLQALLNPSSAVVDANKDKS
jgi:cytochrome c-type biogenesis protein CcmH